MSCASSLEATLNDTKGVLDATVTQNPPEANVDYQPRLLTPQDVADIIEAAGFGATIEE